MKTFPILPLLLLLTAGCSKGGGSNQTSTTSPTAGHAVITSWSAPTIVPYNRTGDVQVTVTNDGGSNINAIVTWTWDGSPMPSKSSILKPGETTTFVWSLPRNNRAEIVATPSDWHTLQIECLGDVRSQNIEYPVGLLRSGG